MSGDGGPEQRSGDAPDEEVDDSAVGTDAGADDAPDAEPEGQAAGFRLAKILVVVTTILGIVSVFTVGVRSQLLDTEEWVTLSTDILAEPEVQEAVATHMVNVLYEELDVGAGLGELLPEDLQGLGSPLAGALRGPFTDGVVRVLDSAKFQALWESTNRTAHSTMVAILRDETRDGVSTAEGVVTFQFNGLILAVGEALGLPESLLDRLPPDAGNIVVLESDELDTVQRLVQILDFLAWFLLALVIALYALAVYVAKGHRLAVLRRIGWSVLAVGVVVLVARAIAVRTLVDVIVEDPIARPSAEDAFSIATALLGQLGWSTAIYGALIVLFTTLMGDGRRATAIRRALAPALNSSGAAVAGGIVVVLLLLIWWQPGRAFEGWVTGLTLIGLVVGAVLALRSRTSDEFPDTTFDDVLAGTPFGRRSAAT